MAFGKHFICVKMTFSGYKVLIQNAVKLVALLVELFLLAYPYLYQAVFYYVNNRTFYPCYMFMGFLVCM